MVPGVKEGRCVQNPEAGGILVYLRNMKVTSVAGPCDKVREVGGAL